MEKEKRRKMEEPPPCQFHKSHPKTERIKENPPVTLAAVRKVHRTEVSSPVYTLFFLFFLWVVIQLKVHVYPLPISLQGNLKDISNISLVNGLLVASLPLDY